MSNYPNMSYCMFENTALAIDQLLDAMRGAMEEGPDAVKEFLNNMSREEKRAFEQMYDLSRELSAVINDMYEMEQYE